MKEAFQYPCSFTLSTHNAIPSLNPLQRGDTSIIGICRDVLKLRVDSLIRQVCLMIVVVVNLLQDPNKFDRATWEPTC